MLADVSQNGAKMPCRVRKNSQEAKGILFLTRDNIHITYPTQLAYGRENDKEFWQRKCNRNVKKEGCELIMFLQSPAVL